MGTFDMTRGGMLAQGIFMSSKIYNIKIKNEKE